MPDDEKEIAEQTDQDAVDSFDEDDPLESDELDDEDDEPEEKAEPPEEEPPSAKAEAEALADRKEEERKKTPLEEPEEEPPKPDKKDVGEELSTYEELPDEVEVNGQKVNLKKYQEDYPEDYAVAMKLAEHISGKQIRDLKASLPKDLAGKKELDEVVSVVSSDIDRTIKSRAFQDWAKVFPPEKQQIIKGAKTLSEKMQLVQVFRDANEFLDEVATIHKDVREIRASKEFQVWVSEQPEKIQSLAGEKDVKSADAVLKYYKESIAKKNTRNFDKKLEDKKKRHDDIHLDTNRSRGAKPNTKEVAEDDAEAAFNEDD